MRQRVLLLAALLCAVAAAAPVPAQAVLKWGPTETITPSAGFNVRVAMNARGDTLAVWDAPGPSIGYSWRAPRGTWSKPGRIEGRSALMANRITMAPDGTALLPYWTPDRRVAIASTRPGQRFGPPQVLTPPGEYSPPNVVIDDEGNAIAGWAVWGSMAGSPIQVATARAGRPFGEPQTIGDGGNGLAPDLAMNPSGAAAAVWATSHGGMTHASYRPPAGSFGPSERVPFEGHGDVRPVLAVNILGELVVAATESSPVGDGSAGTRFIVRSPLGGWGSQVQLDSGGFIAQVLAEPTGAVSFPFQRTDSSGGGRTAYFTTRLPGGTVIGPQRLSSPNSYGPRIAMNHRGDMLGTWSPKFDPRGTGTEVAIADRPAGARFGDERVISTQPNSIGPDGALNDAGQAVVAWTRTDENGAPTELQARVRDDLSLPPLPLPPDVTVGPLPDVSLGEDGLLAIDPRCNVSCLAQPVGLLHGASRVVAGRGKRTRLRARRSRRIRVAFGTKAARLAREALAAGQRPWVSVSITARGSSPRPVTVSRRVRLSR